MQTSYSRQNGAR